MFLIFVFYSQLFLFFPPKYIFYVNSRWCWAPPDQRKKLPPNLLHLHFSHLAWNKWQFSDMINRFARFSHPSSGFFAFFSSKVTNFTFWLYLDHYMHIGFDKSGTSCSMVIIDKNTPGVGGVDSTSHLIHVDTLTRCAHFFKLFFCWLSSSVQSQCMRVKRKPPGSFSSVLY